MILAALPALLGLLQSGATPQEAIPLDEPTKAGRITAEGAAIWYRLDTADGTVYSVFLAGFGPEEEALADPYLERWDAAGRTKVQEDDDSGGNRRALLVWEATETGAALLGVRSYREAAAGSFRLEVRSRAARPGDRPESAEPLSAAGARDGRIDLPGTRSWFRFGTEADRVYVLELAAAGVEQTPPLEAPFLEIYDPTRSGMPGEPGRAIDTSLSWGAPPPIRLALLCREAGDYLAAVRASQGPDTGAFRLALSSRPLGDGDVADRAIPLAAGEAAEGRIATAGLPAWYALEGRAGFLYLICVEAAGLENPRFEVFDAAGRQKLDEDDDGGADRNAFLLWPCPREGSYRIRVSSTTFSGTGAFRIEARLRQPGAGEVRSAPEDLEPGAVAEGELGTGQRYRWYRLRAHAWRRYTISVTKGTLDDPVVEVFEADGTDALASDDDGAGNHNPRLVWICPSDGEYLVGVRGYRPSAGTFEVAVVEREPSPGEAPSTAVLLEEGATVRGAIPPSGAYWYQFVPRAGGRYRFRMNALSMRDPFLEVYDETGRQKLAENDDAEGGLNSLVEWDAADERPLFLRARPYGGTETGEYELSIEEVPF